MINPIDRTLRKEVVPESNGTVNTDIRAKNMPPISMIASGCSMVYSKAASSFSRILLHF